jgi:hypothetical protein
MCIWGIHKRNYNSSRTVWENAGKRYETLGEISVPGTGAFTPLLTVLVASELCQYLGAGVSKSPVSGIELSNSFDPSREKMRLRNLA